MPPSKSRIDLSQGRIVLQFLLFGKFTIEKDREMFGWLKRMDRHSELLTHMAEAVNADLEKTVEMSSGGADSLRSLMIRCTDCKNADTCSDWLEDNQSGANSAPDFCLNREALAQLTEPQKKI